MHGPNSSWTLFRVGYKSKIVLGWRLEAAAVMSVEFASRFSLDLKLGMNRASWSIPSNDPISDRTFKYPGTVSSFGPEFKVGVSANL